VRLGAAGTAQSSARRSRGIDDGYATMSTIVTKSDVSSIARTSTSMKRGRMPTE